MDANRFDEIVRDLSLNAARRGMLAGLIGGGLASLLATPEGEARRHTGRRTQRDDDLSAEKRKKKKCKKCGLCKKCKKGKCKPKPNGTACAGGSCQGGACQPGDEDPPCTEDSCPLPSECSGQALDDCGNAHLKALLADAEPCRADCEGGDSPACRACLEPFLTARLPDMEACAFESCSSAERATARHRAAARGGPAGADARWVRHCDKPGCCYADLHECAEDAAEELVICLGAAVAACFAPIPGACGGPALFCIGRFAYNEVKCNARHGCPGFGECKPDDTCCPEFQRACASNTCCGTTAKCCEGGGCCKSQDVCCRTPGAGEHYCCAHGLECKASGPHSGTCQQGLV